LIVDFAEVLRHRRMVRHYRPDPVGEEVVYHVLRVVVRRERLCPASFVPLYGRHGYP
jgi:hypothetical protein